MLDLAKEIDTLIRRALLEERKACAATVCSMCLDGWPLDLKRGEHRYPKSTGRVFMPAVLCTAIDIHRRGID